MDEQVFKVNDPVAFKEKPKYRGVITQIFQPYEKDDKTIYQVRWTGFGQDYQYFGSMLITAKEADEIKKKLDTEEKQKETKK